MMRRNQHSKSRLSLWACSTVMALCLNSTPAAAAFVQGVQLTPVERIRGPYQHTVVGASLLSDNGTPKSGVPLRFTERCLRSPCLVELDGHGINA